ncbi:MAG: hypothetical protein K1X67_26630 [Fimbriimonadaceae bacterium]|nr:hypothetical protein [Fimbriimonadaceae bacterium]
MHTTSHWLKRASLRIESVGGIAKFKLLLIAAMLLACPLAWGVTPGPDLPTVDTRHHDALDIENRLQGAADVSMGNGEAVSTLNGNLLITHPSSPVFPVDGGWSFGLTRNYNSKAAHWDLVRFADQGGATVWKRVLSGQSWVGFGWVSHMGRIFDYSQYSTSFTNGYYGNPPSAIEEPTGYRFRFTPWTTDAHPVRKIIWHSACPAAAPEPDECCNYSPPKCDLQGPKCNKPDDCSDRPPNDPENYTVQGPDGTTTRYERLVADVNTPTGSSNWISNSSRNGFYPVWIKDLYGNQVNIEYWQRYCVANQIGSCSSTYPYPEAIRRIWSVNAMGSIGYTIDVDVWRSGDLDSEGLPVKASAIGLLKTTSAVVFKGTNANPLMTVYSFHYGEMTFTDDDGIGTVVPMLTSVTISGVGGSPNSPVVDGGTIRYTYGAEVHSGPAAGYKGLLARITTSLGNVSEYHYGSWTSGLRPGAGSNPDEVRTEIGVIRRRLFPDGLGTTDGVGMNRAEWNWLREFDFGSSGATCETATPVDRVSMFVMEQPDGTKTETQYLGHPCGKSDPNGWAGWDNHGLRGQTILYSAGSVPLRATTFAWDQSKTTPAGDVIKLAGQSETTKFLDDNGACFLDPQSANPRQMTVTNSLQTDWGFWKKVTVDGDYMALSGGTTVPHERYTDYESSTDAQECHKNLNHIVGASRYSWVKEGTQKAKVATEFDCKGRLTKTSTYRPWDVSESALPDGPWIATDYDGTLGNPSAKHSGGVETYPDGVSAAPAYAVDLTSTRAVLAIAKSTGVPYKTLNLSIDVGGLPESSTDANGQVTTLAYDALGRGTSSTRPGEQAVRTIYPDPFHVRTIQSGDSEINYSPSGADQIYVESTFDSMGRPVELRRGQPNGTLAIQVSKYDEMGRVVFVSEWMNEADYPGTVTSWHNASSSYQIGGVPIRNGIALGTVYYYGDDNGSGDPLQVAPDALGRVKRITRADGSSVESTYCGPHQQVTVRGVRTALTGSSQTTDAITRYYHDGLGRLVFVHGPSATSSDVEYRYDPAGHLTRVNLIPSYVGDPFVAWRNGTLPVGQVRTFEYDAAGRLLRETTPEGGKKVYGEEGTNGVVTPGYDSAGNLLAWQDAMGIQRNYFFRNTYDSSGRLKRTEKVKGTPTHPATTGTENQITGVFTDQHPANWEFGSLDEATGVFTPQTDPNHYWKSEPYANAGCIAPPPGESSHTHVLYFGQTTASHGCGYRADGFSTPQAVRARVNGVTREYTVSFNYWRQVRYLGANFDTFTVYAARMPTGAPVNTMADRRVILRLNSQQQSFARWQHATPVRAADLWSLDEWPEGATFDMFLVFVFEKGDTNDPGAGAGLFIDDVFFGTHNVEALADLSYDESSCQTPALVHTDACSDAVQTSDLSNGQLTTVSSFSDGKLISRKRYVYRGLGGRVSGVEQWVDWAGGAYRPDQPVAEGNYWVTRYTYNTQGQVTQLTSPYQPAKDDLRRYQYQYRHGATDGILEAEQSLVFLEGNATPPSFDYGPSGALNALRYKNRASTTLSRDMLGRPASIAASGIMDGQGSIGTLWASGGYTYDGAGNIISIGTQQFAYLAGGQLAEAKLLPQAFLYPDSQAMDNVSYNYDLYGNMISRQRTGGVGNPPTGMNFTASYSSKNQRTDSGYAYDILGNMTRFSGAGGQSVAALWSAGGRLSTFFEGVTNSPNNSPGEQYAYDAAGMRVVRYMLSSRNGVPEIEIRGEDGRTLAEFTVNPGATAPSLTRDFVYGGGQLLVERAASPYSAPTLSAGSPLSTTSGYSFNVSGVPGATTFAVDIRTPGGYTNLVSGVHPDAQGNFTISESEFAAVDTNFIRIRVDDFVDSDWSAPVTLTYDPSVTTSSANQVRAVAITRNGTTATVRWALKQSNGKNFRLYSRRIDNGSTYLLTPPSLASSAASYTMSAQSLSVQCLDVYLTQITSLLTNETGASSSVRLGSGRSGAPDTLCGCTSGAEPPAANEHLVSYFRHLDHLGSLRVLTDSGGWPVERTDFYPFGQSLGPVGYLSRRKYTGHERDAETGLDYMLARYKPASSPRFLSPDPLRGVPSLTTSWNRYAYVNNAPNEATDPFGLFSNAVPCPDPLLGNVCFSVGSTGGFVDVMTGVQWVKTTCWKDGPCISHYILLVNRFYFGFGVGVPTFDNQRQIHWFGTETLGLTPVSPTVIRRVAENSCEQFSLVADVAEETSASQAETIDKLFQLIVGSSFASRGSEVRLGSDGFKSQFDDLSNQAQHATANIYLGFNWGHLALVPSHGREFLEQLADPQGAHMPDYRLNNAGIGIGIDFNPASAAFANPYGGFGGVQLTHQAQSLGYMIRARLCR